jgi:hypothetical protein
MRSITPSQRKALNVGDKGCRWPGCDRRPTWTDGHHLKHWNRGGPSDLPNLILLCKRHHWMAHEGHWQVVKADDGQKILAIPPPLDVYRQLTCGPDAKVAS